MPRNVSIFHFAVVDVLPSMKRNSKSFNLWGELSRRIQSTAVERVMLLRLTTLTKEFLALHEISQRYSVLDEIGIFTTSCIAKLKTDKEFKTGKHLPSHIFGGELMNVTGEPYVPTPEEMVYQKHQILKAYEKWINTEKNECHGTLTSTNKNNKKPLSLSDLITNERSEEIVSGMETHFKNIKGKRLKLLFLALQEEMLIPLENTETAFHNACQKHFNWNVGTRQAMNKYEYNSQVDETDFNQIRNTLKNLISK